MSVSLVSWRQIGFDAVIESVEPELGTRSKMDAGNEDEAEEQHDWEDTPDDHQITRSTATGGGEGQASLLCSASPVLNCGLAQRHSYVMRRILKRIPSRPRQKTKGPISLSRAVLAPVQS